MEKIKFERKSGGVWEVVNKLDVFVLSPINWRVVQYNGRDDLTFSMEIQKYGGVKWSHNRVPLKTQTK